MITMEQAYEILKKECPAMVETADELRCNEYDNGYEFQDGRLGFTPFISKQEAKVIQTDALSVMFDCTDGHKFIRTMRLK